MYARKKIPLSRLYDTREIWRKQYLNNIARDEKTRLYFK